MTTRTAGFGPIKATRYAELRYQRQGVANWRLLDVYAEAVSRLMGNDPADPLPVGPSYATEAELLADLDRYAGVYSSK